MSVPTSILKLQIGPVQDFIAQARSTRDLWSASYLLSWLVAAGIRELLKNGGVLIFPHGDEQPLLADPATWATLPDKDHLLTPNLPNLFVATVEAASARMIAQKVESAIRSEWQAIANSVWAKHQDFGIAADMKGRFDAQINRHLSITWLITPMDDDTKYGYLTAFAQNGRQLDAVRQLRHFEAWDSGPHGLSHQKDSLSGKEEAIGGGNDFQNHVREGYRYLFKHDDFFGAVMLVKRVWHLTYLKSQTGLGALLDRFKVRSTRAIAARNDRSDEDENIETASGEAYLAAVAFDGDAIGKWIQGTALAQDCDLRSHHQSFSAALSRFALNAVRPIIEHVENGAKVPLGFLIYAGGDDVVALVPADAALSVARELREAFRLSTGDIKDKSGASPDASVGIAIGHFKSPLQDLIREAQCAEKRAKVQIGRPAFAITLLKRSGEISEWGARWDDHAIDLYDAIAAEMREKGLSNKFPHRVCELLEPYLTRRSEISNEQDAPDFDAAAIITMELLHAAERQGSKATAEALKPRLSKYLGGIANSRSLRASAHGRPSERSPHQELLTAIIGLSTTIAFIHRNSHAS